jgi:hypothetical protein
MKPFLPAYVPAEELMGTARGWFTLWRKGDKNTRAITGDTEDPKEAFDRLLEYCKKTSEGQFFINDKYQVIRNIHGPIVHLSIKRLDKSHEHDWRDYQQIKNELMGPEYEAVEIYPAESRLVDCANQFHLWGFNDPLFRFPFGFKDRMVSNQAIGKGQQRPLDEHQL